jgi:ATP-dependent DNA helicase DinG
MLPEFSAVIFDEAHRLEDVCANYFGLEVSNAALERLFNSIHNPKYHRGIMKHVKCTQAVRGQVDELLESGREAAQELFAQIQAQVPANVQRVRIRKAGLAENHLDGPLAQLQKALKELATGQADKDLAGEIRGFVKGIERRRAALQSFLAADDRNSVYWVEQGGTRRLYLRSALINVAEQFKAETFEKRATVILTSATLTVNRDFRFVTERLGGESAKTLLLDSPFDYSRQAMLVVDPRLPLPTESHAFVTAAASAIDEIVRMSQGRALVLFTSYDSLERVFQLVRKDKYRFFAQGEASTFELLKRFKEDISSVLFATQSFWEGIDVPGEALSCLIITRLPFEVPDDPRLEGIAESLRDQGRAPFPEYQLPQAVLRFRQGFGRLVRNKTDRGVVCILDNRIIQRNYGRSFILSLPKGIPLVKDLSLLGRFLNPTDPCPSD